MYRSWEGENAERALDVTFGMRVTVRSCCEKGVVKKKLCKRRQNSPAADSIRSDEGLTLETSAFESLYGGQFTLSTQVIKPNYFVILPPTQHHSFFRNLPPVFVLCLFGFVEAAKFRDLGEFSDCLQNVWAKSCLPCQ